MHIKILSFVLSCCFFSAGYYAIINAGEGQTPTYQSEFMQSLTNNPSLTQTHDNDIFDAFTKAKTLQEQQAIITSPTFNPNQTNKEGTPFAIYALQNNAPAAVLKQIINHPTFDVNQKNQYQLSMLSCACNYQKIASQIIQLLCKHPQLKLTNQDAKAMIKGGYVVNNEQLLIKYFEKNKDTFKGEHIALVINQLTNHYHSGFIALWTAAGVCVTLWIVCRIWR